MCIPSALAMRNSELSEAELSARSIWDSRETESSTRQIR